MTEDLPIDKCNEFMKMRLSASHTIVSQTFRSLGCNHLELKNPNLIEYVNLTRNWLQHTHTHTQIRSNYLDTTPKNMLQDH